MLLYNTALKFLLLIDFIVTLSCESKQKDQSYVIKKFGSSLTFDIVSYCLGKSFSADSHEHPVLDPDLHNEQRNHNEDVRSVITVIT